MLLHYTIKISRIIYQHVFLVESIEILTMNPFIKTDNNLLSCVFPSYFTQKLLFVHYSFVILLQLHFNFNQTCINSEQMSTVGSVCSYERPTLMFCSDSRCGGVPPVSVPPLTVPRLSVPAKQNVSHQHTD